MSRFKINDVELEYDAFDLDTAETYRREKTAVTDKTSSLKDKDGLEIARGQCKAVKEFFDAMFGAGTGVRICGEKDNLRVCADAYAAMLKEDIRQGQEYADSSPLIALAGTNHEPAGR